MLQHQLAVAGDVIDVLDELHAARIVEQRFRHTLAVGQGRAAQIKAMGSRDSSGAAATRGLGWLLRAKYNGVMREALPARWTELINCMDEKERTRLKSELNYGGDCIPLRN